MSYYSKVVFREKSFFKHQRLVTLNIFEKTLSYQVVKKVFRMSSIEGTRTALPDLGYEEIVVFSHGIRLSDENIKDILPYCKLEDFEPYRFKTPIIDEPGFIGYRDETSLEFVGISNSYTPMIKLQMTYLYDEKRIWPSEKLYRYIKKNYFDNNKAVRHWPLI